MDDHQPIIIAAFSGSLRHTSYNAATLKVVQNSLPDGVILDIIDISQLPLMNEDLELDRIPDSVTVLRQKVNQADGLLICSPEYNNYFSSVTKNVLEWLSRNYQGEQPLVNKPVAMMGASTSGFGTARAQLHLKALLVVLHARPYAGFKQVTISKAHEKFDQDGNLIDEESRKTIQELLLDFVDFIKTASI